jgi:hypothetical protein
MAMRNSVQIAVAAPYRNTSRIPTVALSFAEQNFPSSSPCAWRSRGGANSEINREKLMFKTALIAGTVALGVIGLSGCDVKKTQEGNIDVPKVEVTKKQDGDVTLPKYDVTTPDVKVGSKETTVTVPTVKTEEKKIEVPTVDVTTGKEKAAQKQGG